MNYATPYANQSVNRFLDSIPDFIQKLKDIWQGLVDWWLNAVVLKISDGYWAISHAEHTLIGALAFLIIIVLVAAVFLKRRGSAPPAAAKKALTPREAQNAAKQAAKSGNYVRAGELFEQAGRYNKSINMYMQGNAYTRAAGVYADRLKQPDKGMQILLDNSLWEQAGNLLASLDRYGEAADYYMKAGKQQVAAETFEKAGELIKAGDLYRKQKRIEEAARCYGNAESWGPAGEMHMALFKQYRQAIQNKGGAKEVEKLQDKAKKAAYFLKQAGDLKTAGEVLLDAKLTEYAADIFAAAGEFEKAAELYLEHNEYKKAAEFFQKAGNVRRAAEVMAQYHQAAGRSVEAANFLERAQNYLGAADIWAGQNQFEKAAELYLKGGDSRAAAEMFIAAGSPKKAVKIYEKVGDIEAAIRMIEETGDRSALADLYERTGKVYEAGVLYLEKGMLDKAVSLLQKVGPDHYYYGDALARLGQVFMDKGEYQVALEKLQAMAGRIPLSPTSMDLYYMLGHAYERLNHLAYAAGVYQQLMTMNYHYKDVVMRINNIAHRLQQQGGAQAATVAGGGWAKTGKSIGHRYKIVKELGRGGMGVVYLAEDTHLDRKVAFKVLPEEFKSNQMIIKNFLREAKSLAKLNHPYIVAIFDAGEESGVYYILMEFVEGRDLKEMLEKNQRLPISAGVQVFNQLSQAMAYAHNLQIIHRDIKPANIMWTSANIIKVMDFGLAKVMDKMREGKTAIAGTPYYMSPEQTLGKDMDHRADIYSVGVTMYELLTGTVPFNEGDIGYHHINTPPKPPSQINPQISPEIEKIILKCMAKDKNQRYQSAQQIHDELTMLIQGKGV
jgi:tetratricopeptide (TPR) repeat protein/predicted Ser/Thr protein kinase